MSSSKATLYRGWDEPGHYVWSPFVTKVELRLRLAEVSYQIAAGSVNKSPRGKVPYIALSEKGEILSDSTLILKKLTEDGVLPDINATLSPAQRAHDLALRALLEDKLYFYHPEITQSFERWHQNYYAMRDHVLSALPYLVRFLVGLLIYRESTQTLHGQGTGRFSPDEIAAFRLQIWESFDALLQAAKRNATGAEEAPFWVMGGEAPTEADTVFFGFIVSVLICSAAPESQKVVRSFPVVLEYAQRIHDRYFPDYQRWE
ncbi:Glutathione s-transferase [Neofusicoccum parvum]|nr:Glutathione s-transferase [Neofusicoccum parvum]